MLNKNKIVLYLAILGILLCCISASSATDVNDIAVPDDGTVIEEGDVSVSVDKVERKNMDYQNYSVNVMPLVTYVNVTNDNYGNFFDSNGYTTSQNNLNFVGDFNLKPFGNFKINQNVYLKAYNATFNNIGFDMLTSGVKLDGGNFVFNAPNNADCYAINVVNSNNVKISHTTITYTCAYDNAANYNYAIKAINSKNLIIDWNNIIATLPLKTVSWSNPGISADYVAGVAIQNCNNLNFKRNNLTITANRRVGSFPTLDAVMIADSNNVKVEDNRIYESDIITQDNQYSYLYGIDVYRCNNTIINNNTVNMNGNNSGGTYSGNGTGAAYCIQLTGPYTGVVVSNNNLTTKNKGPNLGIYSQNYNGNTTVTVYGNKINVTGKAGSDPWSLVSGMELQDTNAVVHDNTIFVNNIAPYATGNYAFGISYAQSTPNRHYYNIYNNNVNVVNADYAVYLINNSLVSGFVGYNTLIATYGNNSNTGNNAVSAPSNVVVSNNT